MDKSSGEDSSNSWRERLINAFAILDVNQDGVLSEAELDLAVLNAALDPKLAEIVAVLKSEFDIIRTLTPTGSNALSEPTVSLTNSQIDALANVILENLDNFENHEGHLQSSIRRLPKGVIDRPRLAHAARTMALEVREVTSSNPCLYKDIAHPLDSINCDAVRQGIVGNCVFLSALASVARAHPGIVMRMIKDNNDNTYTVTFPGARKEPIVVNRPTPIELALYTRLTEWGFWPAVLEKAYGVCMRQMAFDQKMILAENTSCPEYWIEIFNLLTGQSGAVELLSDSTIEKLTTILTNAFREKRVVTAWSLGSHTGTTFFEGIPSNHAYSVIGWDASSSNITLRNPWGAVPGSEPESDDGEPLDGRLDGIFSMELDHFWSSFLAIHYEEWSASDPYLPSSDDTDLVPVSESQGELESAPTKILYDRTVLGVFARISFGLAWVAAGIIISGPPIYCLSFADASTHWPTTRGTIEPLDKSIENERDPNSRSDLGILYSYKVLDHTYKSNIVGGMAEIFAGSGDIQVKADYPVGKLVDVHYNPKNPQESCLKTGFDFFKSAGLILWLLSSLLLVLVGITTTLDQGYFTDTAKEAKRRRQRHLKYIAH